MRLAARFLVVLAALAAVYTAKVATQQPDPTPPAPACREFANGQGGGWICARP